MAIEWMPVLSAVLKPVAGKLAVELTKTAKNKVFPGELDLALGKALALAEQQDSGLPASQHLFYHCDDKQMRDFWAKVSIAPLMMEELRKPLENDGLVDRAILQGLFEQVATDLKLRLVQESLPGWIEAFANSYFEQTTAAIRFQAAKQGYLKNLARRVDDVKFVGIDVPGGEEEKQGQLVKIFVMPDVKTEVRRSPREDLLGNRLMAEMSSDDPDVTERETTVERLVADRVFSRQQKQRRAVMLGVPGVGKSTLVNYFALMICQGHADRVGLDPQQDWLPMVIRMRDWALRPQESLLDYCRSFAERDLGGGKAQFKLPPGFFEHWWERGQALILLDGLDEVASETQRKEMAEKIEAFLGDDRQNPTLITSRPIGYRRDFFADQEFTHYELEEFDRPKIELFIENWYNSRVDSPAEAAICKASLREALDRKGQILQLAKNPLLLTIITLIHRYQAVLPRQRHKLYEKAVGTLLISWDQGEPKGQELQFTSRILQPHDLLYIMKKMAHHIHGMGVADPAAGGTLISREDLTAQISEVIQDFKSCSFHDAKEEARCFVSFIRERTGLLNEQGRDQYGFVHKTFQEYLTAEEIYGQFEAGDNDIISKTIQTYLHQPHWREVLLLLISRLKGQRAASAIRKILGMSSEYEQWLHRDLLFAAWCLTENPERLKQFDKSLGTEIIQSLMNLEISGRQKIGNSVSFELRKIFEGLVETNFQRDALELLESNKGKIDLWRVLKTQQDLDQASAAINALMALLSDSDSDVRSSAARTLGELGNISILSGLVDWLNGVQDHNDPAAAINLLKQLVDQSAGSN